MKIKRRTYDHRIKQAIIRTKNFDLFTELNIPKTTAKNRINSPCGEVITLDVLNFDRSQLEQKCLTLEKQLCTALLYESLGRRAAVNLVLTFI